MALLQGFEYFARQLSTDYQADFKQVLHLVKALNKLPLTP